MTLLSAGLGLPCADLCRYALPLHSRRQPAGWRRCPLAVQASAVQAHNARSAAPTQTLSPQDLAKQLLEAELALRNMFQSGKPVPLAAEVAQARRHVADIRAALAQHAGGHQPAAPGPASAAGAGAAPAQLRPDAQAQHAAHRKAAGAVAGVAAQRARASVSDLARVLAASSMAGRLPAHLSRGEALQAELLQLENTRLRQRGAYLLAKQDMMEELLHQHFGMEVELHGAEPQRTVRRPRP